jgi:putative Ca2+/H+ antiporter (TMEM165/GDT1 family)
MKLSLFLATFGTVFVTELIGDKMLYTISALATRYRLLPLFCGFTVAFMAKMLAAVLLGQAIATLPTPLIAGMTATTFFIMALILWLKESSGDPGTPEPPRHWSSAVLIGFAAIFFAEWGDVGQIAAATLVARYQAPFIVWLGATLAMVTKGILAMTVGVGLRKRVPKRILRYGAVSLCLIMGILSVLKISI